MLDQLFRAELYLYFHEELLAPERTEKECQFLLQQLPLAAGDTVLDLACGHGRHANYLAEQGLHLVAWDINGEFIRLAAEEAKTRQLKVDYHCRDILKLAYVDQFDAVLLLFNTLGFFSREEAQDLMNRMATALKTGGRLFLDIKNRDHLIQEIRPYSVVEKGSDLMIDRLSFDPKTGTTLNRRMYLKDGQRYEAPFSMTLFNYTDIERMAGIAGLSISQVFGHWNGVSFDHNSRRIMLILRKE